MSYGIKYRCQWLSLNNNNSRKIEILEDGYAGSVTDLIPGMPAFIFRINDGSNLLIGSYGIEGIFNFQATSAQSITYDEFLSDIYQNKKIKYYSDGANLSNVLWIEPESTSRAETEYITYSITGVDGIGRLKDVDYLETDGTVFSDVTDGLTIIKRCLNLIGFDDLDIRVQLNTYESALLTSSDNSLKNVTHNNQDFYENNDGEYKPLKALDVLDYILTVYNCRLFQKDGYWNVVNDQEYNSYAIDYNWSDLSVKNARYISDRSIDITPGTSEYRPFDQEWILSKIQPIKKLRITFKNRNLGSQLLDNGDFSNGTTSWNNNNWYSFGVSGGELHLAEAAAVGNPDEDKDVYTDAFSVTPSGDDHYLLITFSLELHSIEYLTGNYNSNPPYVYIQLIYPDSSVHESANFTIQKGKTNYIIGNSAIFPVTTSDNGNYIMKVFYKHNTSATLNSISLYFDDFVAIEKAASGTVDITYDSLHVFTNDNPGYREEELSIICGDVLHNTDLGALKYGSDLTTQWSRYSQTDNVTLINLLGQQIINNFQSIKDQKKIRIYDPNDNLDFGSILLKDSKAYTFSNDFSKDTSDDYIDGTITELISPLLQLSTSYAEIGTDVFPDSLQYNDFLTLGSKLWSIGGENAGGFTLKVYYSSDGNSWSEAGTDSFPAGRILGGSFVANNKLWYCGGINSIACNDVYYSSDGITWGSATVLPVGLYRHAVVYDGLKIVVFGGHKSSGISSKIYQSSNLALSWTEAGTDAMPDSLDWLGACYYNGLYWITGGYNGAAYSQKVYYSSNLTTWSEAGTDSLPYAFIGHRMFVFDNKMWIMGGSYTVGMVSSLNHSFYYSIDGITWNELLVTTTYWQLYPAVSILNNDIYFMTGADNSSPGFSDKVYIIDNTEIGDATLTSYNIQTLTTVQGSSSNATVFNSISGQGSLKQSSYWKKNGNDFYLQPGGTSAPLYVKSSGDTSNVILQATSGASGNILINSNVLPNSNNAFELGSSTSYWNAIYGKVIYGYSSASHARVIELRHPDGTDNYASIHATNISFSSVESEIKFRQSDYEGGTNTGTNLIFTTRSCIGLGLVDAMMIDARQQTTFGYTEQNGAGYRVKINGSTYMSGQITIAGGSPGAGKYLQCDATGLASWASGTGSTVWSSSGSDIYYNSGNVAIGTTTFSEKLTVDGNIRLTSNGWVTSTAGYIVLKGANNTYIRATNTINIADDAAYPVYLATGGGYIYTALTASRVVVLDASARLAASTMPASYLDATSSIQTQLNSKQATITGAATTIVSSNLTASRVLVSDGSGKVAVSSVTPTTLSYLDATSSIQTQLNARLTTTITSDLTFSTSSYNYAWWQYTQTASGSAAVYTQWSNTTNGHNLTFELYSDSSSYSCLNIVGKVQGTNVNSAYIVKVFNYGLNLFYISNNGAAWVYGNMSVESLTDRTPYPDSKEEAFAMVQSMGKNSKGGVDHSKLHAKLVDSSFNTSTNKYEPGRNLSMTVSAQNEVIKDLIKRIEKLES